MVHLPKRGLNMQAGPVKLLFAAATCLCIQALMLPSVEAGLPKIGLVDLHVDLSYQLNYRHKPFFRGTGQFRAESLARAGVIGVVLPLYVTRDVSPSGPRLQDLEGSYQRVFEALSVTPPYRFFGCGEATRQDRNVNTWLSFEGAHPIADRPLAVPRWVARGVRVFGLMHSYNTAIGASATDSPDTGLTESGRRLVREIIQYNGIVDVSHASDKTTRDVIELALEAGAPVVATHSNARRLANHPRNLSDEQIKGIAETGGVIGINFHSPFLARGRPAELMDVVRHIEHVVKLVGDEHVGLGSDFEGDIRPPSELSDISKVQRLAELLQQRGHSRARVSRIFSKNALRLLCRAPKN